MDSLHVHDGSLGMPMGGTSVAVVSCLLFLLAK
jgi:hypothetical protein